MLRSFRAVPKSSRWKVSDGTATFIAGGMSSTIFWPFSFPFDGVRKWVSFSYSPVVNANLLPPSPFFTGIKKSRMMADSPTKPRFPTWRSAARHTWSEGGPKVKSCFFFYAFLKLINPFSS